MTNRQKLDGARELRLWIGQVIVPAVGVGLVAMTNPEVREFAKDKYEKCKNGVSNTIQKFKK